MLSFISESAGFLFSSLLNASLPFIAIQLVLFGAILYYLKKNSVDTTEKVPKLSREEEDEIIKKWKPRPLVDLPEGIKYEEEERIWGPVEGRPGKFIEIEGIKYLNMATHNYLGLVDDHTLDDEAERCIRKYGVGSCGPRGFYGTVDVHLELEQNIAKFMRLEETALYSYGFSTVASAIPSYAKNDDVIFADEFISFPIQKGVQVSKSIIKYFKHNDFKDLERLLNEQAEWDTMNPKKAKHTRRFCVVEGIYMKTGEMCPLRDINRLCRQHKVRLFVDESVSFGTVGLTGRGVTEHLNVPVEDIDMITGTMEYSMAAFGGFVVGPSYVVDHQRISGLGYCFSASLPPLLAGAGIRALKIVEENPKYVQDLQDNCQHMHNILRTSSFFNLSGHPISPIKHISLKHSKGSRKADKEVLTKIILHVKENAKIALIQPSCIEDMEALLAPPSIRITVNRLLTNEEMNQVGTALQKATQSLK